MRNIDEYATPHVALDDTLEPNESRLFGLWAAAQLGLDPAEHDDYAWSVLMADGRVPGASDVIAKVRADFADRGMVVTDRQLLRHYRELRERAALERAAEAAPVAAPMRRTA